MRDAAYTLKTGLKLFSRRASSAALQKDKQYKEFIRHNEAKGWNNERLAGEKGRVYAVATDEGVLFFSDSEKGMKARNSYLQHLADGFFNMAKGTETLKMYEMETPSRQVAELADNCIDKLAKSDLRSAGTQLRKSEFSFTSEKLAGKEMLEGAVCTDKYDLRPDYNNFDRVWKSTFPVSWKMESLLLFATRIPLLVQRSRNVSSWDSRFLMISALSDLMTCRLLLVRHRPLQPSDKIGWSSEKVDFLHCQVFSITSQSVRICCMHS